MTDLPQVGQKYQHKKWGEVEVCHIRKRGRGYQVEFWVLGDTVWHERTPCERLKDFKKATA